MSFCYEVVEGCPQKDERCHIRVWNSEFGLAGSVIDIFVAEVDYVTPHYIYIVLRVPYKTEISFPTCPVIPVFDNLRSSRATAAEQKVKQAPQMLLHTIGTGGMRAVSFRHPKNP